jgi:asparaginyl-tRNA synthetase
MSLVAREVVAKAKYSGRVIINAILGRQDGGIALIGQKVIVGGWVKTGRVVGRTTSAFLELNDGSCSANLQVYAYFSSVFLVPSLIPLALLVAFFLLVRFVPSGRHDLGL